jgi:ABC-type transport system involved in multi-copper enzyme maturation permease subunit
MDPENYPTAGQAEDPVVARVSRTLSGLSEVNAKSFWIYFQILTTLGTLIISLILVATESYGNGSPVISYTVFFAIFCLLGWCVILFLLPFIKNEEEIVMALTVIIGALTGIFNLAAALAMTVRIAPGGSCSDSNYLSDNALMDGSSGRCRLVMADVAFLWFGTNNIFQR